MSKVDGVNAKLVIDPRVDAEEQPTYYIEKAADYVRYYQDVSTSSIHFSIVPPNKNIYVNKKMYITLTADFTFAGDAGVGNVLMPSITYGGVEYLAGQTDALRWMPLQSVTESLSITLNQTTISQNLSDFIEALSRNGLTEHYEARDLSLGPSMHDQFQALGDWVRFGNARNPLASYGNNPLQPPRGAVQAVLTSNTQTAAVVRVTWTEPVMMSPLLFSKLDQKGFLGLTNIDVTWNLGDLSRMWSHDAVNNNVLSGPPTVAFVGNPRMRLLYLTPPLIEHPLPLTSKYPYYEVNRYPTDLGVINAGLSNQAFSSNNIQLSSIPKRIFLFARERNADRDYTSADSYARIDQIRVQFDNKNALLGSAEIQDLYSLSVSNGLQMSYPQFSFHCGSVVCLDFGRDISLDAYQSVGMHGQYQLQIDFEISNVSEENRSYTWYIVTVNEGIFTISNTETSLEVGNVRPFNVLEASQHLKLQRLPYHEAYDYMGGSFWSSLKRIGRKALDIGKKAFHGVQTAMPYIKKGAEIIGPLLAAAGYSEAEIKQIMHEAQGAGITGAGITGGRKIAPRRKLRKRQ